MSRAAAVRGAFPALLRADRCRSAGGWQPDRPREWRLHTVGGRASEIRDAGFVSDLSLARRNEQSRSLCAEVDYPFQFTQYEEAWSSPANE